MMNLIQRFLSKDRTSKAHIRKNFIQYFYSLPEHSWILESSAKEHFDKLFAHLPATLLESMMIKYPVVFIPSSELKENHRPGAVMTNTIVVFPEFQSLLMSDKKSAVAYIAHEVAFILLELEGVKGDILMAEVAADKFVSDLGLTSNLKNFFLC